MFILLLVFDMGKPFFYKFIAADFLASVIKVDEKDRSEWVLNFALDLVSANIELCKTEYAKELITETAEFRHKMSLAGKKGMESRYSNEVITKPNEVITKPNDPVTKSSSSTVTEKKKIYGIGENILLTETQHKKLKEKLNGSTDDYINRLSTYNKLSKYKDHYLTILSWWSKDQKEEQNKPKDHRKLL